MNSIKDLLQAMTEHDVSVKFRQHSYLREILIEVSKPAHGKAFFREHKLLYEDLHQVSAKAIGDVVNHTISLLLRDIENYVSPHSNPTTL
jgi:ubiquitin C-terminal hydrolase